MDLNMLAFLLVIMFFVFFIVVQQWRIKNLEAGKLMLSQQLEHLKYGHSESSDLSPANAGSTFSKPLKNGAETISKLQVSSATKERVEPVIKLEPSAADVLMKARQGVNHG